MSKKNFIKPVLVKAKVEDGTTFQDLEIGDTFCVSKSNGNTYMKLFCDGLPNSVSITSSCMNTGKTTGFKPSERVYPTKVEVTVL